MHVTPVSSNSLVSRLVLALAFLALVAMSHLNQGSVFEGSLDLFIAGIEERRQKEMGIASLHPSYGPSTGAPGSGRRPIAFGSDLQK